MTKEEAQIAIAEGKEIREDAGRGYRRVVASPRPQEIIELGTIKALLKENQIVIAGGGGGIPVIRQGNHLKGVAAVIDKDFASSILAQQLNADYLIMLTSVEKVAINYNTPNVTWLSTLTVMEAKKYISEGHFAAGSMLPKVEAAALFASSGDGREALITLLEKAKDGIHGLTGTRIIMD
jgi:carbamate kinase